MKCVIPGTNVKVFGRAIHSLARLGEELYLETTDQGLSLKTVNSSRSAFASFTFSPSFFTHYSDNSSELQSEDDTDDSFKCKIPIKSCLAVFKSLATLEKTVDKCKIKLDVEESRLVFQLHCKHGIVKTYNLAFIECETLQAVFSKHLCPNILVAQAKLLCEIVVNFQTNQEEVTLIVDPEKTRFKNYVEDEPDPNKVIHTELTLLPEEFDNYQVGIHAQVTFCLKELRAILAFAESSNLPLAIHFESAGKPIIFAMGSDPSFEGNFVLATLARKSSEAQCSQQTNQSQYIAPPSTVKKTISIKKTRQTEQPSKAGGDNNHSSLLNTHRLLKEPGMTAAVPGDDDDMGDDVSAIDLEAIDKATAEHLAESSQTSEPLVDYPQLDIPAACDEDLHGSPVIPVHPRSKVAASSSSSSKPVSAANSDQSSEDDDLVPGTPPSKKFRAIFRGLSQASSQGSQRTSAIPAVLAEDSDYDSS